MSIIVNPPTSGSGASSLADGADVTQGAKADAAWSGSGDGTVVGILKSVRTLLNTLAGAVSSSRMNANIARTSVTSSVSISSAATDSTAIDISTTIAGGFIIPAAFTGTSVSYKASYTTTGHQPLYDQYGSQVTTPVAVNRAFPFPAEAAGFASLIIVSSASESGARTIQTVRKG